MDDTMSSECRSQYQINQFQFDSSCKGYQHPALSITTVMTAYSQNYRVNRNNTIGGNNSSIMQNPTTTDLCKMMDDCTVETDSLMNQFYPLPVPSEHTENDFSNKGNLARLRSKLVVLDKAKAGSWDKHDSMHATTRRNNRSGDDDARSWNNLESLHSMKALSRSGSRCGAESSQSLSSSFNEQEMLHASNSDYNDSMCSFASFGETSFSDSLDAAAPSIQMASKTFTRSFDGTGSNNESVLPPRISRQPMQRGISYRNCGNSLSQIQETAMEL